MFLKVWRFIAVMLAALTLGLGFCHLMQLPARMAWDQYLWVGSTVQGGLYAWFGSVGAMIFITAVIVLALNAYFVKEHGRPGARLAVSCRAFLRARAPVVVGARLSRQCRAREMGEWARARGLDALAGELGVGPRDHRLGGVRGLRALGRLGAGGHAATRRKPASRAR